MSRRVSLAVLTECTDDGKLLLQSIFLYLTAKDRCYVLQTCRFWNSSARAIITLRPQTAKAHRPPLFPASTSRRRMELERHIKRQLSSDEKVWIEITLRIPPPPSSFELSQTEVRSAWKTWLADCTAKIRQGMSELTSRVSGESPLDEIEFWRYMNTAFDQIHTTLNEFDLESILTQIQQQDTHKQISADLSQQVAISPLLQAVEDLQIELSHLKRFTKESSWNSKYLTILETPFRKLIDCSIESLVKKGVIQTIMNSLRNIYKTSGFYKEHRMLPLLAKIVRVLVDKASPLLVLAHAADSDIDSKLDQIDFVRTCFQKFQQMSFLEIDASVIAEQRAATPLLGSARISSESLPARPYTTASGRDSPLRSLSPSSVSSLMSSPCPSPPVRPLTSAGSRGIQTRPPVAAVTQAWLKVSQAIADQVSHILVLCDDIQHCLKDIQYFLTAVIPELQSQFPSPPAQIRDLLDELDSFVSTHRKSDQQFAELKQKTAWLTYMEWFRESVVRLEELISISGLRPPDSSSSCPDDELDDELDHELNHFDRLDVEAERMASTSSAGASDEFADTTEELDDEDRTTDDITTNQEHRAGNITPERTNARFVSEDGVSEGEDDVEGVGALIPMQVEWKIS